MLRKYYFFVKKSGKLPYYIDYRARLLFFETDFSCDFCSRATFVQGRPLIFVNRPLMQLFFKGDFYSRAPYNLCNTISEKLLKSHKKPVKNRTKKDDENSSQMKINR